MNAGPRRFGELKRGVPGISEKRLIQGHWELKADGVIHRKVCHEVPIRVEYSVTAFGATVSLGRAALRTVDADYLGGGTLVVHLLPQQGRHKPILSLLCFDRFGKLLVRSVERLCPPPLVISVFASP